MFHDGCDRQAAEHDPGDVEPVERSDQVAAEGHFLELPAEQPAVEVSRRSEVALRGIDPAGDADGIAVAREHGNALCVLGHNRTIRAV